MINSIREIFKQKFVSKLVKHVDKKTMKNEHKILHFKFKQYGANAKEWMLKCILLLPEIEKHRIWEQKGFGCIYEYTAKLAGMSRNTVDDALWILHRIEDKPALRKVIEAKGLNAVRPVVAIVTPETAEFWAQKAMIMSRHTLETYVREFKKQYSADLPGECPSAICEQEIRTGPGNNAKNPHQQAIVDFESGFEIPDAASTNSQNGSESELSFKEIITMNLDPEVAEQLRKLKGQGEWNELMKQLLQMREAVIEQQKPESVETESRNMPVKTGRYVFVRTNGTCSYPGCTRPIEFLHHTKRFALEKTHDPDYLHGLCKEHEQIAHHGLIENEESAPPSWKIRKEPDQFAPKFKVDKLVGRYRAQH